MKLDIDRMYWGVVLNEKNHLSIALWWKYIPLIPTYKRIYYDGTNHVIRIWPLAIAWTT